MTPSEPGRVRGPQVRPTAAAWCARCGARRAELLPARARLCRLCGGWTPPLPKTSKHAPSARHRTSASPRPRIRGRDGGHCHPRITRDHAAALPQHARLPGPGPDAAAGPGRGGSPPSGLGIDPRRAGSARSVASSGPAGGDAEGRSGRNRHGPVAGDVPVAPDAGPGNAGWSDLAPRRDESTARRHRPCARAGRASVEVASQHYSGATIRAKAAAGFQLYAAAGGAADFVRRALGAGSGSRRGGRGGGSRDMNEVFEI